MFDKFEKKLMEQKKEKSKKEKLDETLKSLEKIEKNSKKIKLALDKIDSYCFPQKPIPIKEIQITQKSKYDTIPVARHHFEKDEEGNLINEYYEVNTKDNDSHESSKYSALGVAIHEIRHRFQHTFPDEMELFTEKNIKEMRDMPSLKKLQERVDKNLIDLIKSRHSKDLSPNDFDAVIVESIIKSLLKKGVSISDVVENILKKDAREIVLNLNKYLE